MARIILVGGGSSSGKSYITSAVVKEVGAENVTRLTLDDYYKPRRSLSEQEQGKVNYDHPKAFDWPLMRQQIKDLKQGKPIAKPLYDFVCGDRRAEVERIVPAKVVVIEGIMALVDDQVRKLGDIKVFIDASPERRFLRRIIRDAKERGRRFDDIVNQYFRSVQPMYGEIVEPSKQYADLIVNNDGVENLAIDVLASVFRKEIEIADNPDYVARAQSEEFCEQTLSGVFKI